MMRTMTGKPYSAALGRVHSIPLRWTWKSITKIPRVLQGKGHFDLAFHRPVSLTACFPWPLSFKWLQAQEEPRSVQRTGANHFLNPVASLQTINQYISPKRNNWNERLSTLPLPSLHLFFFLTVLSIKQDSVPFASCF